MSLNLFLFILVIEKFFYFWGRSHLIPKILPAWFRFFLSRTKMKST